MCDNVTILAFMQQWLMIKTWAGPLNLKLLMNWQFWNFREFKLQSVLCVSPVFHSVTQFSFATRTTEIIVKGICKSESKLYIS